MKKFSRHYHVALTAPSGSIDPETVAAGKAVLEKCGCQVSLMPHLFSGGTLPHLSAVDSERLADINDAIADERIDIIWAVRGGAGSMRILDGIDYDGLKKTGKFFAGFSDITAIHWAMAKYNCDTFLAAPMMKFLAEAEDDLTADSLTDALNGAPVELSLRSLNNADAVSGTPLPGNLAVAASLCGSGFFPDTAGKILILEDIGEAPYRIDRMLTQLLLAGAFDCCAGIIFGNFTGCGEVPGVTAVLKDFANRAACPVFSGAAHGHELPFFSFSGRQQLAVKPC